MLSFFGLVVNLVGFFRKVCCFKSKSFCEGVVELFFFAVGSSLFSSLIAAVTLRSESGPFIRVKWAPPT